MVYPMQREMLALSRIERSMEAILLPTITSQQRAYQFLLGTGYRNDTFHQAWGRFLSPVRGYFSFAAL